MGCLLQEACGTRAEELEKTLKIDLFVELFFKKKKKTEHK